MPQFCPLFIAALSLLLPANARGANDITASATKIDGTQVTGQLLDWTAEFVTLQQEQQALKLSPSELLRLSFSAPDQSASLEPLRIELVDGSTFPLASINVRNHTANIETPLSKMALQIPTSKIRSVQLVDPGKKASQWRKKLAAEGATGDRLLLVKKDSDDVEVLTGVINDVSDTQINFTWEGEEIPVKRSKIGALSYYHAEVEGDAAPRCLVHAAGGILLAAQEFKKDGESVRFKTITGIPIWIPLSGIRAADYSAGKLVYLSDLQPLTEKWIPIFSLPSNDERVKEYGMPRRDTSLDGTPLTLYWPGSKTAGGDTLKNYPKGLAVRSRTELVFRLPKEMRRFSTIAGIDPETLAQGDVVLTINADGETLFEESITGSQAPTPIDVSVAGKKQLSIVVDYGKNLDLGDRLHLVDARLIK